MSSTNSKNLLARIETFGRDAAEQEDANNYLAQHFIRTESYIKAAEGTKTIILGRKGSGKSAVFLFLRRNASTDSNTTMAFVVPEDVSAGKIRSFSGKGINEQASKTLVWKYLFFVLIARFFVEAAKAEYKDERDWPEDLRKIRRFLVDNDEMDDLETIERIRKWASKIRPDSLTIKLSAIGEVGMSKGKEDQDGLLLTAQLDRLEDFLVELTRLSKLADNRFRIYVDQVDDFWQNDESSNQMVIGLLLAAYRLNTRFTNVRCAVFLRTDIFQAVDFHNKDHLHGSELEIQWQESDLVNLIYDRISRALAAERKDLNEEATIKLIFSDEIDGGPVIKYIIGRTLFRPRDLIQFCNISLEMAKKNKHTTIEISDVLAAENTYSKWKISDLVTEYKDSYPFLNDFLVTFGKRLGHTTSDFDRADFLGRYETIRTDLANKHPSFAALTVDLLLAILYNINFIGVVRGDIATYKYSDTRTVSSLDKQFRVHPAFWNGLGIQSTGKSENEQSVSPVSKDKPIRSDINMPAVENTMPSATKEADVKIMAGTGEVSIVNELSDLGKVVAEMESIVSRLDRIRLDHGMVAQVRAIAYLSQSKSLLENLENKTEEYKKEGIQFELYAYTLGNRMETIQACKLLEATIQEIEKLALSHREGPERFSVRSLDETTQQLASLLSRLYSILIEEYKFDMLRLGEQNVSPQNP